MNTDTTFNSLKLNQIKSLLSIFFFFGVMHVSAQVSGLVFRDYNANGIKDNTFTLSESGVPGITVTAYNDLGVVGTPATTAANGTYTITGITGPVRIEFTNLPTGDFSGAYGTANGTSVQFVTAPVANVDFAINYPVDFCASDDRLAIAGFVNGDLSTAGANAPGIMDAVLSFPNTATGNINAPNGISTSASHDAQFSDLGACYGLAYNKHTKKLFTSAFIRRHSALGPLGIGGLYTVDYSGGTPVSAPFIDLVALGQNVGTISSNAVRGLPQNRFTPNHDVEAFAKVFKTGLGDIDISDDGNTLFISNLFNNNIIKVDITAYNLNPANLPTAANISTISLPAGINAPNGVARLFALKYRKGKLYVGVTATAENAGGISANLYAYVYAYDVAAGTWTLKLTQHLAGPEFSSGFRPWSDDYTIMAHPSEAGSFTYPMLSLTDI